MLNNFSFQAYRFPGNIAAAFLFRTRLCNTAATSTGIHEVTLHFAIDYRTRLLRMLHNEVFSLKAQNRCR